VRPSIGLNAIVTRLRDADLGTAVITTPEGRLVGVLRLEDAEAQLP
jgi:hypothetical protein